MMQKNAGRTSADMLKRFFQDLAIDRQSQRRIRDLQECPKCYYHRGWADVHRSMFFTLLFFLFVGAVVQQLLSQFLGGYFFAAGYQTATQTPPPPLSSMSSEGGR